LPIREVLPATPRARVVRIDLGGQSFEYAPGQAVMAANHGYPKAKPYSIANAPEDARREGWLEVLAGVDAEGNPGAHLTLERGTQVDVEGPLGSFTFPADPKESRFVFIAGGTGIAPLRAMIGHALRVPHREVGLFYSARTPEEFAYDAEFTALADAGRILLVRKITRAEDTDHWTGPRGRISRADLAPLVHSTATLCFICGPAGLVQEMKTVLGAMGVARERIRVEEWG
jgi:NAD(P)H-flavin reductase